MRLRYTVILFAVFFVLFAGCSKKKEEKPAAMPSFTETYTVFSEADLNAYYSLPKFKNLSSESMQNEVNKSVEGYLSEERISERKTKAMDMISQSDLSEYSFSELGNYKVFCCDNEYLSFTLSMEQRFTQNEDTLSVRQNFLYNYDSETGKLFDVSSMFKNKNSAAEFIARELYDRLLNMECLESDNYSEDIFKKDIFNYCVIIKPKSKIAVITTAGKFGLKISAGAPIVEIGIPEEYFI